MAADTYGIPTFGLADTKIASWTSTGAFGTAVDVPSAQEMSVTLNMVSGQLTGDDAITAVASRAVSGEVKIKFGGVSIAALEVLIGNTATSSVASPNAVKQLKVVAGDNMPYFAISGVALSENDSGDLTIFLPKCKITSNVTLAQMKYGEFSMPELTALAVSDGTYGILNVVEHQTAVTTAAIPTANIA